MANPYRKRLRVNLQNLMPLKNDYCENSPFNNQYYNKNTINWTSINHLFTGDYTGFLLRTSQVPYLAETRQAKLRRGWDPLETPSILYENWKSVPRFKRMLWYYPEVSPISRRKYEYPKNTPFLSNKELKDKWLSRKIFSLNYNERMELHYILEKRRDLAEKQGSYNFTKNFNSLVREIKISRAPNNSFSKWHFYREGIFRLKTKFNTWENFKENVGYYDQQVMHDHLDNEAIIWDIIKNFQSSLKKSISSDSYKGRSTFRTLPEHIRDPILTGRANQTFWRPRIINRLWKWRHKREKSKLIPWKRHTAFFNQASGTNKIPPRIYNNELSRWKHRQNMEAEFTTGLIFTEVKKYNARQRQFTRIDDELLMQKLSEEKNLKLKKNKSIKLWNMETWEWPELSPTNFFGWNDTKYSQIEKDAIDVTGWQLAEWASDEDDHWQFEEDNWDYEAEENNAPYAWQVEWHDIHSSNKAVSTLERYNYLDHWSWLSPYWWGNYMFIEHYFEPWLVHKNNLSEKIMSNFKDEKNPDVFWFKFSHVEKLYTEDVNGNYSQIRRFNSGLEFRAYEKTLNRIWQKAYNFYKKDKKIKESQLQEEFFHRSGLKVLKTKYFVENPFVRYYTWNGPNFFLTNHDFYTGDLSTYTNKRSVFLGPGHMPSKLRKLQDWETVSYYLSVIMKTSYFLPGISIQYYLSLNIYIVWFILIFFSLLGFYMYWFISNPFTERHGIRWKFGHKIPTWRYYYWSPKVKGVDHSKLQPILKRYVNDPKKEALPRHSFNWWLFTWTTFFFVNVLFLPYCFPLQLVMFKYTNWLNWLIFFSSFTFIFCLRTLYLEGLYKLNAWMEDQISPEEYDRIWQEELKLTLYSEAKALHLEAVWLRDAGLKYNKDDLDDKRFKKYEDELKK